MKWLVVMMSKKRSSFVALGRGSARLSTKQTHLSSALEAVRTVFEEVITPTCEVFLQLKHEDWSGEFVIIREMDSIPDRCVIRAVVASQVGACYLSNPPAVFHT